VSGRSRAKKPRQLKFPALTDFTRTEHGGAMRAGKRKLARPIATKAPMHVVLRASRARGAWSLLHPGNRGSVDALIRRTATRFDVELEQLANSGNHLHLIIRGRTRGGIQGFFRTLPALLARRITGAKKGSPKGRFWDALLYTRPVSWGRDLLALKRYLLRNDLEAVGFLSRGERTLTFAEALARRGLMLKRPG